jgi:hypothetical protein
MKKQKPSIIEEELIQVKAKDQLDLLDFHVKLSGKLMALSGVIACGDTAPTRQAQQVFEELSARVNTQLQQVRELMATDIAAFDKLIREAGIPMIVSVLQESA